jgi:hypothetical protein
MIHPLVLVARLFRFVREIGGANRGVWVQTFQRYTDNAPGDSWCASFVSFVLSITYQGKSPLTKTASCATMLAEARAKGFEVKLPLPGDLFFYLDATGHAHHVGIVTASAKPLIGIAGNTSGDGTSDNGDGVYEHAVSTTRNAYVRLPAPTY